ncbi:MAG: antitoxin [Propionibacterium sp.]|nr:antitoxin [Propionibacterium sp.]
MGLFDNIGDKVAENAENIKSGIDKAGDFVDEKTGDKYKDQVDKAQDFAKDQVDKLATDKK